MARCGKRNYMDELHEILCAIENTKPEPEVCNTRCPPLGCPKGFCIGTCCYRGRCDACCVSRMPCCPPPPEPPSCCIPRCLPQQMGQRRANRCSATAATSLPLPPPCPPDRGIAARNRCPTSRFHNSGCGSHGPHKPATCN